MPNRGPGCRITVAQPAGSPARHRPGIRPASALHRPGIRPAVSGAPETTEDQPEGDGPSSGCQTSSLVACRFVTAPIIPGAEPWSFTGEPRGVLVLHGFTGNPQSMRPLAEALAATGFSVEMPLLPGHGTQIDDMVPTRWEDWSGAADEAYEALAARCDSVVVAGLSMGGSLSCWLALRHPEIAGLALINPIAKVPVEEFRDVVQALLDDGTEIAPGIGSDIAKEGSVETAYEGAPLRSALSLFDGVDAVGSRLSDITCPVLLMNSREDHVVPTESGDFLEASLGGPVERIWLERSFHVATLDWDAPVIEERVVAFAAEVLRSGSSGGAS